MRNASSDEGSEVTGTEISRVVLRVAILTTGLKHYV